MLLTLFHRRFSLIGTVILCITFVYFSLLFFDVSLKQNSLGDKALQTVVQNGVPDHDSTPTQQPIWLIATMSPAQAIQRRAIIRATWQALYSNDTVFRSVFFLARPPPGWEPVIEAENCTHGDLVVLDHIEESHYVATHTKPFEFYKWLVRNHQQYAFVSKADDDTFVDPIRFADQFLYPLLDERSTDNIPPVIIARKLPRRQKYPAPSGMLITMSWRMVKLLVKLHRQNPVNDHEDGLVGRLLYERGVDYDFIELDNRIAFDTKEEDGEVIKGEKTAWAPAGANLTARKHGVGPGALVPHKLKTDEEYLRVAACFGPDGVMDKPEATKTSSHIPTATGVVELKSGL